MKKSTSRSIIIKKAFSLLAENGLDELSVNNLIEETGYSKGAFFYHFKSKEDLFIVLLEEKYKELQRVLRKQILRNRDPKKAFDLLCEMLLARFEHPSSPLNMIGILLDPGLKQYPRYQKKLRDFSLLLEEEIDAYLQKAIRRRYISSKSKCTQLSHILITHFVGISFQAQLSHIAAKELEVNLAWLRSHLA